MATISPEEMQYMEAHASDDQTINLYVTCALCTTLPAVFVALRFVARRRNGASFKSDDWLILSALVPLAAYGGAEAAAVYYGLGRHFIFARNLAIFAQLFVAVEIFYASTIILVKLSILSLYNRIFPSRKLRLGSIVVGALVILYSLALILVALLQCIPLSKLWTPSQEGVCINTEAPYITTAVMNVVTDIFILALPIKNVWRLQLRASRKLQIIGIFALGGIVCIFGIVRAWAVASASSPDITWTGVQGGTWSLVEIAVGCICACLPTLRPLFISHARASHDASSYGQKSRERSENRRGAIPLSDRGVRHGISKTTDVAVVFEDNDRQPFAQPNRQGSRGDV